MNDGGNEFEIVLGRIGNQGRGETFINQVLRAMRKAGHTGPMARTKGGRYCRSTFGRGRTAFGRSRLFGAQRRVVIKARVVRHRGRAFRSTPLPAHVAYLERDGVTRDGQKAHMFSATEDSADAVAFAKRGRDDRHHFRFVIAPEDAGEMTDLKAFTRDLVTQMERDLDAKVEWVAIDHWNTDNPHVHLLVRGVVEDGSSLVIARDYISYGLRSRAEDLVSMELGPRPENEVRSVLAREVDADRWTRLDAAIKMAADDTGFIDLRADNPGASDPEVRRFAIGRLQRLERMGLAVAAGPGQWRVEVKAERTLRDLGTRSDIIETMHRAITKRGQDRGIADYAIETGTPLSPIIGRLVATGLHNELTGEAYAVIDGTDGRAHHVRFRGIEAFCNAPPAGGIAEVRRFGSSDDPRPTLVLASRSDIDLARQVTARGATWLDYRLVEPVRMPLAAGGFGQEVRDALAARAEHLVAEGLARREGPRIILQPNLVATLRDRDISATVAKLAAETGLPYIPTESGEMVAGTCRQCLTLTSGRFGVIDNGLGFALVPWTPALERYRGRQVAGVAKEGGGIEWSFGRERSLQI